MNAVQINWQGSFRSGSAFTPMIAGDVNGDGYSNDRAFIVSPTSTTDPALAEGMRQLIASASDRTRDCLERQLGKLAERNSCRSPWTSSASLTVALDRAKFRMPQRANISFSLTNPLGAADLFLHGSDNLKGWGQGPIPDQSLFYVRGFDAQTRRYKYEVNQRFGATRPQFMTLRSPVTLTTSMRVDLGPVRERQSLITQLMSGRSLPGSRFPETMFRSMGSSSVPNPMATILRQQDSLRLTAVQADSLAVMNRYYTYRTDSIWAPVARYLATLPQRYNEDEAYDRFQQARRAQIDMMAKVGPVIRDLLTPEQRRKVPQLVLNYLDPRYLVSIRNGNGMYVNASSFTLGGPGFAVPMAGAFFPMEAMAIIR
jgi:hypothetical protein